MPKTPGEMRRNSLTHLTRGADGIMFFQRRQSRAGAEKWHSAMLPHGGTKTRIWSEVTALGAELAELSQVRGTRVSAQVDCRAGRSTRAAMGCGLAPEPSAMLDSIPEPDCLRVLAAAENDVLGQAGPPGRAAASCP
ncbi:beta-galactosidase [Streptomyces sp. NBC_00691]|uniref:beta-galactosidase n=1 Tax=Streptomyces sp. NBC_00691 TaxID=2903671 RepID=UPI003FA7C564